MAGLLFESPRDKRNFWEAPGISGSEGGDLGFDIFGVDNLGIYSQQPAVGSPEDGAVFAWLLSHTWLQVRHLLWVAHILDKLSYFTLRYLWFCSHKGDLAMFNGNFQMVFSILKVPYSLMFQIKLCWCKYHHFKQICSCIVLLWFDTIFPVRVNRLEGGRDRLGNVTVFILFPIVNYPPWKDSQMTYRVIKKKNFQKARASAPNREWRRWNHSDSTRPRNIRGLHQNSQKILKYFRNIQGLHQNTQNFSEIF